MSSAGPLTPKIEVLSVRTTDTGVGTSVAFEYEHVDTNSATERHGSATDRYASATERYGSATDRYASATDRHGSVTERYVSATDRYANAGARSDSDDDDDIHFTEESAAREEHSPQQPQHHPVAAVSPAPVVLGAAETRERTKKVRPTAEKQHADPQDKTPTAVTATATANATAAANAPRRAPPNVSAYRRMAPPPRRSSSAARAADGGADGAARSGAHPFHLRWLSRQRLNADSSPDTITRGRSGSATFLPAPSSARPEEPRSAQRSPSPAQQPRQTAVAAIELQPQQLQQQQQQQQQSLQLVVVPPPREARRRRGSLSVRAVERSVSAGRSPPPAGATGLSPAQLRDSVLTLLDAHAGTIAVWEGRVGIAEWYRDKSARGGGRPSAPRTADRGFLERVRSGVVAHLREIRGTQDMLAHEAVLHEDAGPVFAARGSADRLVTEQDLVWAAECRRMHAQLEGMARQTDRILLRVERLLQMSPEHDPYLPTRAHSRGSSPARDSTPRKGRRGSVQRADGQLTFANGFSDERRTSVLRGDGAAIDPHSASSPQAGASADPQQQPQQPQPQQREEDDSAGPRVSSSRGRSRSVASVSISAFSEHSAARALHPDTVQRHSRGLRSGSPYDLRSPYGRLSPQRAGSVSRDGTATALLPGGAQQAPRLLKDAEATSPSASAGPRGALTTVSTAGNGQLSVTEEGRGSVELGTYRSPRGPAPLPSTLPDLSDTQRQQLLLTIEYYESHANVLRKNDLKTARECFMELYGPQSGLRQYCNWIDELALQALRLNR